MHDRDLGFMVTTKDGVIHYFAADSRVYSDEPTTVPLENIRPSTLPQLADVKTHGTAVVAFREGGTWGDHPAHMILHVCLDYVKSVVIPRLRPFFEAF